LLARISGWDRSGVVLGGRQSAFCEVVFGGLVVDGVISTAVWACWAGPGRGRVLAGGLVGVRLLVGASR
jgi:hypothetical protein